MYRLKQNNTVFPTANVIWGQCNDRLALWQVYRCTMRRHRRLNILTGITLRRFSSYEQDGGRPHYVNPRRIVRQNDQPVT
jgi:hypothetical protein